MEEIINFDNIDAEEMDINDDNPGSEVNQPANVNEDADTKDEDGEKEKTEKSTKPKRISQNPRPTINAARLCGRRGLRELPKLFSTVTFKGKGYEKDDLNKLMKTLEHWAHRLYPKFTFDDVIKKCEKLGCKRPVQTCIKKIRLDIPFGDEEIEDNPEEDDIARRGDDVDNEEESRQQETLDPFDELIADHFPDNHARPRSPVFNSTSNTFVSTNMASPTPAERSPPRANVVDDSLTEDQRARMERNRLLAQERRKSRLNVSSKETEDNPS